MSKSSEQRKRAKEFIHGAWDAESAQDFKSAKEQHQSARRLLEMARELDRPLRMTKQLQGIIDRAQQWAARWDARAFASYEKRGLTKKVIDCWERRALWLIRIKKLRARPRILQAARSRPLAVNQKAGAVILNTTVQADSVFGPEDSKGSTPNSIWNVSSVPQPGLAQCSENTKS
jgi:hypothetical protein